MFFALEGGAIRAEPMITILDAPALFVDLVISILVSYFPHWTSGVLPEVWRSLFYPLFAVPAWIYLGRGIDSIVLRRRIRKGNAIFSLVLTIVFCGVLLLVRFGLTPEERHDQVRLHWIMTGFALWAVLFAIPFTTWLARKLRGRSATQALSAT